MVMTVHKYLHPGARECIARCSGLKSIDTRGTYTHDDRKNEVSVAPFLTQLTEIRARHCGKSLAELSCMTLLQRLHLFILSDEDCSLDEVLECMPSLRSIDVRFIGEAQN